MYNSAIILRFENAGIFPKRWKEKDGKFLSACKGMGNDDRIFDGSSDVRTKDQWIDQPTGSFHFSFIANLIRVLIGTRPISKYRNTCVEHNEKDLSIEEIAKRTNIKIDSFIDTDKEGNKRYLTETMTTRKSMENSWSTAIPSWIRFKNLLPEELYSNLVNVACDICKCNAERMIFEDVAKTLFDSKDSRVQELIDKARENKCEPLAKLLSGNKVHSLQQAGYRGLGPYLRTLVTKSVSDIIRLDGYICIPVTHDELKMFRNGSGVATIFDGGVVRIDRIINLEYTTLEMITSDYQKVQQ
jgi:hypothetical protein